MARSECNITTNIDIQKEVLKDAVERLKSAGVEDASILALGQFFYAILHCGYGELLHILNDKPSRPEAPSESKVELDADVKIGRRKISQEVKDYVASLAHRDEIPSAVIIKSETIEPTEYQPVRKCKGPCGQVKPLDDFGYAKKFKDGRQIYCRKCATAMVLASRKKAADKGLNLLVNLTEQGFPIGEPASQASYALWTISRLEIATGLHRKKLAPILRDLKKDGYLMKKWARSVNNYIFWLNPEKVNLPLKSICPESNAMNIDPVTS